MVLARTDCWQRPSMNRSGSAIKQNRNFVLLIFSIFEEPSVSTTQPQAPPIVFEPRSGESWRDPFPMYKALRDHDPVHRFGNDRGEFWILSRFKDVFAAAVDAKTFSSAQGLTLDYEDMEKLGLDSPIVMMQPLPWLRLMPSGRDCGASMVWPIPSTQTLWNLI